MAEVSEVVPLQPERGAGCQTPLWGNDPSPFRHQVIEMPHMRPVVTEYPWHQLMGPDCGETTRTPWPEGIPSGPDGARVPALVALCTGSYRLSKRTTAEVRADRFGVPMSGGPISQSEQLTPSVGAEPLQAARDQVAKPAVAPARLGETFRGLLVTDRYRGDNGSPVRCRQLCGSHLLRDFEAIRGRGETSEEMGEALRGQAHPRLTGWHRVGEGTLKGSPFRSYMTPLRREVERLLAAGRQGGVGKAEGTCREILKRRQALWTFVQVEGVKPTNHSAERAIRPGVQRRNMSVGTQSEAGSRFVESMMTVVATLKQQKRNVLEYLTAAHEAALRGEAPLLSCLLVRWNRKRRRDSGFHWLNGYTRSRFAGAP
jgi:transposase